MCHKLTVTCSGHTSCHCHPDPHDEAVAALTLAGLSPNIHFNPKALIPLDKARTSIVLNRLGSFQQQWKVWLTEPDQRILSERVRWFKVAPSEETARWMSIASRGELNAVLNADSLEASGSQPFPAKCENRFASSSGRTCMLVRMPPEVLRLILAQLDFSCPRSAGLRTVAGTCAALRRVMLHDSLLPRVWFLHQFGCDGMRPKDTEVRKSAIEGYGVFAERMFTEGEFVGEYCGVLDTGHGARSEHTFSFGIVDDEAEKDEKGPFFLNPMCLGDAALKQMMYANHSCEPNMRPYVVGLDGFFDDEVIDIFLARSQRVF